MTLKISSLLSLLVAVSFIVSMSLLSRPAQGQTEPPPPPPPETAEPAPPGEATQTPDLNLPRTRPAPPGGRQLLLPDISLIGIFNGLVSNDKRDPERDSFSVDEVELAFQSFVYPGVRADVFFVFAGEEAVVEEAFLTAQNLGIRGLPLSATLGRRFVPFGRVNQLHPHSYPYVVRPNALTNLVAEEALTGDGGYLSYLFPTRFFAQLDLGLWNNGGGHGHEEEEGEEEAEDGIVRGEGAGFENKFFTARLWTAFPLGGGDLEVGGSYARGKGEELTLLGDGNGNGEANTLSASRLRGRQVGGLLVQPTIDLSSFDLSYRRAGRGASRLLLRGEYVHHRQKDGSFSEKSDGYYVFADQLFNARDSLGARYDWSEFPNAPGLHESAVSLIATRRFTEQSYARVQLINGQRPGKKSFTEVWFQVVFGMGPHTHSLE